MNINNYIRDNIKAMKPYSSARDEFKESAEIYLDANENPFTNGLNRYPDPYQQKLKEMISNIKGPEVNQILLGNGSDEIIDLIMRVFCEPSKDNVIITPPTYGMYSVTADLNNISVKESILSENFELDVEDLLSKVDESTKLIILCSPNNPSGNCLKKENIIRVLNTGKIVVLDEAYIDFAEEKSLLKELQKFPNLIITQTLSKAYGLAGLRIGMCFASEEIIDVLNKIKPPYNINELSQQWALIYLKDKGKNEERKSEILKNKETLLKGLKKIECINKIYPSDANFFLIKFKDASFIYNRLLDKNIVVRDRSNQPLCSNCLRITVGTEYENQRLLEELNKIQL